MHDITLFVSENFGGDQSLMYYIGFKGESTNIKKGVVEFTYEAKPQLKDHKVDGGDKMMGAGLS